MQIKIEKIVFPGVGLGRDGNGRPIFVSKAVPGDKVEIKITKDKKSFAHGVIEKIIEPSLKRIEPKCKHFDECGGCEHQNISYDNQLEIKQLVFQEVLDRAKIEIKSEKIIPGSNHPFYYRNSVRFFFLLDNNKTISFARHHYHKKELVPIEKCLLQSEISNKILKDLKEYLNDNVLYKSSFWQIKIREGKLTNETMIELITTDEELPNKEGIVGTLKSIDGVKSIYHTVAPNKSLINLKRKLIFGSPIIYEKVGKFRFQISPESFFQTNSYGAKTLYDIIKKYADVEMGDSILDLYCGTGTIGIYLSTMAKKVTGIDVVQKAINDARDNAKLNHIHNCEFICLDLTKKNVINKYDNDVIIVDPPRAGLSNELINQISKLKFKRLIYASCNPSTFARDIKQFEKQNIILKKVQPIDNFPQTHHIECVGLLSKR